jgi:putative cardiolipin synthase
MLDAMLGLVDEVREELLIESAYFVLRDRGVEKLQELENRGVRVRILTNSLASNDVLAAHAGYAKRRRRLVASNIELYELRPYPGPVSKGMLLGRSKAALHTKALVFDRRKVFIGSLNLDPRSGDINTEAGLLVDSPDLAAQVIAYLDEGVDPYIAYRLLMDEDYELYWVTESNGQELRYDKDPLSTATQRAISNFISLLPVEDQL